MEVKDQKQGKDLAMFLCWLLGNGALFPWNSMLTIEDYYAAIFPRFHPTRVLTIVYQPCALITISILLYREAKGNTRLRNLVGFVQFFVATFLLIIVDLATGGKGGIGAFVGVCVASALFGIADGFVEGAMVGDLALMCPEFMQSFLAGLAASGVLTSALRCITKGAFENSKDGLRKGALLFFSITCFFELVCVVLYAYVFPRLHIVKYFRMKAAHEGSQTVAADLAAGGVENPSQIMDDEDPLGKKERLSTKELFLQNIDYVISLYAIYVLTLAIFPGFLSEDTGTHSLGTWYAIVLIAAYNVLDLVGRYVPVIKSMKLTSRKGIMAACFLRFLFVPAFYFTANYGGQGWMIFLTSLLGLTNGYLTVCIFTEAPKGYKAWFNLIGGLVLLRIEDKHSYWPVWILAPEQNALGNILALCLLAGISSGVMLDWLWLIGKGW